MDNQAIVSQPVGDSAFGTNYNNWVGNDSVEPQPDTTNSTAAAFEGGVTVRTMTFADAAFVGRCLVTGFQAKVEKHVSKDKIEPLMGLFADTMATMDAEALKNILVAEYNGRPAGIGIIKYSSQSDAYQGDMNFSTYYSVLGCCNLLRLSRMGWWEPKCPEGHLYVDQLAVMEGFRGRGIGKALLVAIDQRARDMNLQAVCLWVAYENAAKRLYERHGYVEERFLNGSCAASCATGISKWHYMVKQL